MSPWVSFPLLWSMSMLPPGTTKQLSKQDNWYHSFHKHKSKLKQDSAFIINWFLEVLSWYFSPEAYIKGVSFNVETSSFQLTSLQTLSIKADLPCDPWLSNHFLEAMLGALIRHRDLRGLLGEDKWGNQTVTPFGLHWDPPEPERLSRIPPNSSPLPRGSRSSGLSLALHSARETDECVVRSLPMLVVESPREPRGLHSCMLSSL